ncbi:MAG: PAS domain S-box protein, partial [Gammaproteobacteria bacterium]|nr:PAS domain S-box protein [Gammaproteobacteria bacterium]
MKVRKLEIIKPFAVPLIIVACLSFIRWQHGVLLFHTLAELFSVMVGILMLVIVWNTRRFTHNDFLVYLGIGYFWIAVLDTWHTFTVEGIPFFDISNAEITLHFWIYTRFLEALLLLSASLFLKRNINPKLVLLFGAGLVLLVSWASFTLREPVMLTPDGLTLFKVYAEYFIIALLGLAIFVYILKRALLAPEVFYFLLASLSLTIVAELFFTLYTDFNGIPFVIGHLFKFLSFWMIFQAIVRTTLNEPFHVLAQASSSYDAIPHPAIVVDTHAIISQVNMAAEISSSKPRQELVHKHVHPLFHPKDVSEEDCELCQAIKRCAAIDDQLVFYPDRDKWFLVSLTPIKVGDKVNGMVQLLTDITERKLAKKALQESEYDLAQLLNTIPNGIQKNDLNGVITYSNTSHHRILGRQPGELIGRRIWDNEIDDTKKQELQDYLAYLIVEQPQPEPWISKNLTKDGRVVSLEIAWDYLRDTEEKLIGFISVISDITKLKQAEEQILHQAHFDSLTDLPNRFLSLDRLSQLINEAQRDGDLVAVLYLDLDDFKKIND